MEIYKANVRERSTKHILHDQYPIDLNMYSEVPGEQIDIEEFQNLGVERVKLLKVFETVNLKNVKDISYREQIVNEATEQNLKYFMPLLRGFSDYESRRLDHLSHFILRLCYCRSEEYRKWFIARELDFFRLKFSNADKNEDVLILMKRNNLNYTPISDDEKRSLSKDLIASIARNISLETSNIYKIPFTLVLDLVKGRKTFIKNGIAYVHQQDLVSLLCTVFRTKLSYSLSICAANISNLESDERLARILRGIQNNYTDSDYSLTTKDSIPISALDALSTKSFPLCMRNMHETFRKTHHLRYMARVEYGLFLKGIGVTLEDSLKFWREGFTKKDGIDSEKFEKTYAYSIRHSYGKEGKRANYMPHNCIKIISSNVSPGDNHGCPFKHSDLNILKEKFLKYKISPGDIAVIANFAGNGHYQLACRKFFEVTHNIANAKGINHPNLYFEESQKLLTSRMGDSMSNESVDKEMMSLG